MKILNKFILLAVSSLIFISCGMVEHTKDYRLASDGLLYYKDSNKLYSGTISDSSVAILQYDVVEGKKNGSFLVFYPDGTLAQSGYLLNNKNVGEWKYFYPNGNLECKGVYEDDIPQGEWEFYYPNGKLKNKGSYKDGLRDKIWYDYNEKGELNNIYYFQKGKLSDRHFKMS